MRRGLPSLERCAVKITRDDNIPPVEVGIPRDTETRLDVSIRPARRCFSRLHGVLGNITARSATPPPRANTLSFMRLCVLALDYSCLHGSEPAVVPR